VKVEARGVKTWQGTEGAGYQATLYIDGVRAALVTDDGHGGALRWHWLRPELEDLYRRHAESRPPYVDPKVCPDGLPMTPDLYVAEIVEEALAERRLKRWCRTKTVYRLPGHPRGEWRIINVAYSPAVRGWILDRHPAAEIANDRLRSERA
jgi:hypothetical protein